MARLEDLPIDLMVKVINRMHEPNPHKDAKILHKEPNFVASEKDGIISWTFVNEVGMAL
jgi:hypothetical protein